MIAQPGRALRPAAKAAAGLTALALVACSPPGKQPAAKARLQTTTPPGSGTIDVLKWALPWGEPTSLDPAKVGDYSPSAVVANLCEGLISADAEFTGHPALAERTTRPDATTVVYDLRRDAKFWNGAPVTAEDVVFSLNRNMDPKVGSFWSADYESVKSIKATGAHQVTVTFTEHDALFEEKMTGPASAVSQKSFVQKAGAKYGTSSGGLMCSGPYEFETWKPGQSLTITRNPDYWNTALKAKAGKVSFSFVTDTSTLTTALQSGEFDGAYEVPVATAATLGRGDAGTVYNGPSTQMVELIPTEAKGPMSSAKARTALDLAIDKQAIASSVYGGNAEPLNSFIPPFMWGKGAGGPIYKAGYDALQDTAKPDLAAARKLLQEAGLGNKAFTVATQAGDEAGLKTLTYIQGAAKDIGLSMAIKQFQPTEFSDMFYDKSARTGVDMLYAVGYSEIAKPLAYAAYFATPGGLFNWTGYNDPAVAKQLKQAMRSADPKEQARLFVQAQAAFAPQRLAIPVVTPSERLFMKKTITGAPASFAYITMPWAAMVGKK
ncbi:ABC transporter substrate-binding protein [Spirillospora sp. NPDC050679]